VFKFVSIVEDLILMQNLTTEDQNLVKARNNMVQNQIVPNNVTDIAVLNTLKSVPKHMFVESKFQPVAYSEGSISAGSGRIILEPVIFAKMLQACAIKKTDIVLDIGCGLGYSTAVLALLSRAVVGIENDLHLIVSAKHNLSILGIDNFAIHSGNFSYGHPDKAPYDIIFINGALRKTLEILFEQLSNGGRLVSIEQTSSGMAMAVLYRKHQDQLDRQEIYHCSPNYIE
ncbi:protein-L-isoaspartate O-methyltransferase, partial [Hyalomma marginatum]